MTSTPRILIAGLIAVSLAAPAAPALSAGLLKPRTVITGKEIRLSDLLEGGGTAADFVIAKAPDPGKKTVLAVSRVVAAARLRGISFTNPMRLRRIVVVRDGDAIARQRLQMPFRNALRALGVAGGIEIEITHDSDRLIVPKGTGAASAIALHSFDYDAKNRHFVAELSAPAGDSDAPRVRVQGWVHHLVRIPVPRRMIARGEVIDADDIQLQDIRADRIERQALSRIEDIVGARARYVLRPGRPVRSRDLRRAVTIARGALVTMIAERPGMSLSAHGRALKGGNIGDAIPILNLQSKRTVQAVVSGPGTVHVTIRRQALAAGR